MKNTWLLIFTILWITTSNAGNSYLPEPPDFNNEIDSEKALAAYPLGIIDQNAAFSHHGGPDKKVSLANGIEGWIYFVGYGNNHKNYQMPSGKVRTSKQTAWELGARSYTLVFDDGVVTDVIYKEDGSGPGLTSMELQHPKPIRGTNPNIHD